jgi:hypothetical protein
MEIAYSYWGGIDRVYEDEPDQCSLDATRYLTMDVLSPKRLLMSEILFLTADSIDGLTYRYNHGRSGWSWNTTSFGIAGHLDVHPNPQATGRGQLFGDGRVVFKPIPLDENLPTEPHQPEGLESRWDGVGSGWVGVTLDVSYF